MRNLKQTELHRTEERKAEDKTRKGNGRPQESALGHSQKIVAGDENELERKLRLETATRRLRRRTKKEKQVWRRW